MKTIKFRAWGGSGVKHFVHFSLLSQQDDYVVGELEDGQMGRPCMDKDEIDEVMQFTGLLDKNGKEIYEGDILKIPNSGRSEVKWNYGEWNVEDFSHNAGSNNIYNFLESEIEVIGDIYSTPELLS